MSSSSSSEGIYIVETLVETGSSSAELDLSLSLANAEVTTIECVQVYAKPLDRRLSVAESSVIEEAERTWTITMELEFDDGSGYEGSLGDIYTDPPKTVSTVLDYWHENHREQLRTQFNYMETEPWFGFVRTSTTEGNFQLYLPPRWRVVCSDALTFEKLGLTPLRGWLLKSKETEDGRGIEILNPEHDMPLSVFGHTITDFEGKIFYTSVRTRPNVVSDDGTVTAPEPLVKPASVSLAFYHVGPSVAQVVSTAPREEILKNSTVRQSLGTLLSTLSHRLNLHPTMLTCEEGSNGLKILARQDLPNRPSPLTVKMTFGRNVVKDLALESDSVTFHLGKNRYVAAGSQQVGELVLGPRPTKKKPRKVWTDPLRAIAPFSLVVEGHEATSYLSGVGFAHILAYVDESVRVQAATPIRTKLRSNRLSARFFSSELEPCIFLEAFKFYMVLKIKSKDVIKYPHSYR